MKNFKPFVFIFALASFWGFFEILHLPNGLVSALAVLALVMGRRMVNVPGTSALMGLMVCFYKTYSSSFFVCQWSGIMSVALSFELFASVFMRAQPWSLIKASVAGTLANLLALPVFVVVVVYVAQEPHWAAGGWDRVVSYAMRDTLPAVLISIVTGPLGVLAGERIVERVIERGRNIGVGVYSSFVIALWLVASAVKYL
jgi:hypothetical protein